MVSLCIDQGNSHTKAVLFEDNQVVEKRVYKQFSLTDLQGLCDEFHPEAAILGSVIECERLANEMSELFPHFVHFTAETPVPIQNAYATPQTLGRDRLASAIGAAALSPNQNLLIIDTGSAITFDLVSADGTFLGGNIAPGKRLRLKSLHDYTDRLPIVTVRRDESAPAFGQTTDDAIRAGVVRGIAYEIDGYIRWMHSQYSPCTIYLTGGDAKIFLPLLENDVCYEEMLVPLGLKRILDYNA